MINVSFVTDMHRYIIIINCLLLFVGCQTSEEKYDTPEEEIIPLEFARGFQLMQKNGYSVVSIFDPWNKDQLYHTYFMGPEDIITQLEVKPGTTAVVTPVQTLAISGSPYVGFSTLLGLGDKIVGVDRYDLVYDASLVKKCEEGKIQQFGEADRINYEVMAEMDPDVMITSGFPQSEEKLEKVHQLGIPTLLMLEWQEQNPLGRAEWIKVIGLLTGKYADAVEHFHQVVQTYSGLAGQHYQDSGKTIMCGHVWEGVWYTPGGSNYLTSMILNAGFRYAWKDTKENGSVPLSMEAIIEKQLDANVWINPGKITSLEQLKGVDERYGDFAAFKSGDVFANDKRARGMANDFWETGAANPHLILNDLVNLNRDSIADSLLYYFRRIPQNHED